MSSMLSNEQVRFINLEAIINSIFALYLRGRDELKKAFVIREKSITVELLAHLRQIEQADTFVLNRLVIDLRAADNEDLIDRTLLQPGKRIIQRVANEDALRSLVCRIASQNYIVAIGQRPELGRDRFPGFSAHDDGIVQACLRAR